MYIVYILKKSYTSDPCFYIHSEGNAFKSIQKNLVNQFLGGFQQKGLKGFTKHFLIVLLFLN